MPDTFYPSVDLDFIHACLINSGKLEPNGTKKIGSTTAYVFTGPQAIFKRTVFIRELEPTQVCFEQATGLAIKFGFWGPLIDWFKDNRNWKDGGYIIPHV